MKREIHRLSKYARHLLMPKLSFEVQKNRIEEAKKVATFMTSHVDPQDWITRIILFGSLARAEARLGSDTDLAVLTNQSNYFGADYAFVTNEMCILIDEAISALKLSIKYKINPLIIAESWYSDSTTVRYLSQAFIENVHRDGVLLASTINTYSDHS